VRLSLSIPSPFNIHFFNPNYSKELKQILRSMRYGSMSAGFIMDIVLPNENIKKDQELCVMIINLRFVDCFSLTPT